jgi:hypothetical protein
MVLMVLMVLMVYGFDCLDAFDGFAKVDYTQLLETEDNTVGIEEISCAGGACLI